MTRRFKFRLDKVLTHRERLYDAAHRAFLEAAARLRSEEEKLKTITSEYKRCLLELTDKIKKSFTIRDIGTYYRYLSHLKKEIALQSKRVHDANQEKEVTRKKLIAASQDKEILLKVKDKRFKEYLYDVGREEQKLIDEVSTTRFQKVEKM